MAHQRKLWIVFALGVILGSCGLAFADTNDTTPPNSTQSGSGESGLRCRICNDALGSKYACKKDGDMGENDIISLPCTNYDEFRAANKKLVSLGNRSEETGEPTTKLKVITKYSANVKLRHLNLKKKLNFACRRFSVDIGENDVSKGKRRQRTIGSCGVYYDHEEHENSKMECITKGGSAKSKFTSCKCDQTNCNGAGRLFRLDVTAGMMLTIGTFIGLLSQFRGSY